jgi:hypothetical protein
VIHRASIGRPADQVAACLLLILGTVVAAGCAPAAGEVIAARIHAAQSPIVREVDYQPANMLDPAEVDVWLRPEATEAQANTLWCDVIVLAGGQPYEGDRGVAVFYSTGTMYVSLNPVCAASPS